MTPEALIEAAHAMLPSLRKRAREASRERRVPAETIAEFHRAGILRVLQPARFGGHELDYVVFSDIIQILAQGCASSAWVYGVLGEHKWVIAMFPERAQQEVWGADASSANAASCASFSPAGRAQRVAGGYLLNGRWSFASGCDHAQWAIVGSFVDPAAGNVPGQPRGAPELRDFLVPMTQLAIDDDWHVLGLSGTGSKSLVADSVFVPDWRSIPHEDLKQGIAPGREVHQGFHLCRSPRSLLASFTLVSVVTGAARRAVDLLVDAMSSRVSRGQRIAELESMQIKVAEAAAEADTAALLVRSTCERNTAALKANRAPGMEDMVLTRRNVAYANRLARSATDRAFIASGGQAIYEGSPIEAVYRDVIAGSAHLFLNWEVGAAPYGQFRLGVPVKSPYI